MAYKKATKSAAEYGPGMPAARCSICKNFLAPDVCIRVQGHVARGAWCKYFEKKDSE